MKTSLDPKLHYAESKVHFYQESWLRDHHEAQQFLDYEDRIRDLNILAGDLFDLDCKIQEGLLEGFCTEDLAEKLLGIFSQWHSLALSIQSHGKQFLNQGYDVEGTNNFNNNIGEIGALLKPSDVLTDAMSRLRDMAVEEHRAGYAIDGLMD